MMKFKYKIQDYQTRAVESVVDCFKGQPYTQTEQSQIDPFVFKNGDFALSEQQILENIQTVQRRQELPQSDGLEKRPSCKINIDVEMETGTGKTYCYIKSIFEMNRKYGWTKFIIMVPSIAIREGVYQSLADLGAHFQETYSEHASAFIYNSKHLRDLDGFSSNLGINIMVINIQAFNARGKDNRRIYDKLDDFGSRRPMDVIAANQPILILDEPQKMQGPATQEALKKFNPMFIMRYSATHKTEYNKIHRLDALDAYQQKLVKKIKVSGIEVKNLRGASGYLYLESIKVSAAAPVARIEIEVKHSGGNKRTLFRLKKDDDLYKKSNGLQAYEGFVVAEISAKTDSVEFTNGHSLKIGDAVGDETQETLRRLQIRETIRAHLETEQRLFDKGIKVLSLFFIDKVAKYRVYNDTGAENGEYAKVFEEEYEAAVEVLKFDGLLSQDYKKYLDRHAVEDIHDGYFSMDKKSKQMKDPTIKKGTSETDDVRAYDWILKNKKTLLSFNEPTRFIFSHSALREGWDNPNVFVICTLKNSDNTISRRQEVGRGMRIALNDKFERQDDPETVHDTNILTVVASESYTDFVNALQKNMNESLSARPSKADKNYFLGKVIKTNEGDIKITEVMAKMIARYLVRHDYVDLDDKIDEKYYDAKENNTLAELDDEVQPHSTQIFGLIDSVYSPDKIPKPDNARKKEENPLNDNFNNPAFQELWKRINHKAVYALNFKTDELIKTCIENLNKHLNVPPLRYTLQRGEQNDNSSYAQIKADGWFNESVDEPAESDSITPYAVGRYDIIGKIAEDTELSRNAVGKILSGINEDKFNQFQTNPELFITKVIYLIKEHRRDIFLKRLQYDTIKDTYRSDIFIKGQHNQV
ncbi:MAG: DEAD/DEAH box helicase family protein [Proteobacteria bacterium]|nr:DEAD/DEAH box helicase family protein [Pseudomonadota bacterium]